MLVELKDVDPVARDVVFSTLAAHWKSHNDLAEALNEEGFHANAERELSKAKTYGVLMSLLQATQEG